MKKLILILLGFVAIDYCLSVFLESGLKKYYGIGSQADIVINGSSMTMSGLDPDGIQEALGKRVLLYAKQGVGAVEREIMLDHVLTELGAPPDFVVYEVNPLLLSQISTSENAYLQFYPFLDNEKVRRFVKSNADPAEFWMRNIIRSTRFDLHYFVLSVRGHLALRSSFRSEKVDKKQVEYLQSRRGTITVARDSVQIACFARTITTLRNRGIKVMLLIMPLLPDKRLTYQSESYRDFVNYFVNYALADDAVLLLNLSEHEEVFDSSMFYDPVHLNSEGQQKCTKILIDAIAERTTTP